MTTPTGQISMSDVALEIYGNASRQIDMEDPNVYTLAGVAQGNPISMSQLKGKTWSSGVTFTPGAGSLSNTATYPNAATLTISCSQAATWTYSLTSGSAIGTSVSCPSGSSATYITFTLNSASAQNRSATWTVSGVANGHTANYTVNLTTSSTA